MNEEKALIINKRDTIKGLYVFCKKCKRTIDSKVCGKTGKGLRTCKNTDQHCFRAVIAIPYTNGLKRKTRVFNTRSIEKAIALKFDFENELIQRDYQNTNAHLEEIVVKPIYLIECMAMYIGYLNNEDIEEHKKKIRTQKHIKDVERYFMYFVKSLKNKKIDYSIFKIDQINDKVVAIFHNYLLSDLNYRNKTYNKVISQFRHFINWLINSMEYDIKNPFIGVTRRHVTTNNVIINKNEFDMLLEQITVEYGFFNFNNGKRRNYYRTWMSAAFRLALETGLRREEFMTIKFSDIKEDEKGKPTYINIENYKVNRLLGKQGEARQFKSVPITKGLTQLLIELDYEKNKSKDIYLIGAGEESKRETLMLFVSKAFTHFWSLTGVDKKVQLKNLRKTYLTALVQHFGDKASMISNHSGINVLKKHYVNSQLLVSASKDFKVL